MFFAPARSSKSVQVQKKCNEVQKKCFPFWREFHVRLYDVWDDTPVSSIYVWDDLDEDHQPWVGSLFYSNMIQLLGNDMWNEMFQFFTIKNGSY